MCSLLKLFKYPFIREKSSDEVFYESTVAGCMADIGKLEINKLYLIKLSSLKLNSFSMLRLLV